MEAHKILHGEDDMKERDRDYFNKSFMFRNATSDDFLDNIVQDVPLKDLKEVIQSCYFDENLQFCAVLSRINDNDLKKMLQGNYLFELWFEGELLY